MEKTSDWFFVVHYHQYSSQCYQILHSLKFLICLYFCYLLIFLAFQFSASHFQFFLLCSFFSPTIFNLDSCLLFKATILWPLTSSLKFDDSYTVRPTVIKNPNLNEHEETMHFPLVGTHESVE